MAEQVFPTKGNLIAAKKSLVLSRMGFDLMDRKRNILIREMMMLLDKSKLLRDEIDDTFENAYKALEKANLTLGLLNDVVKAVPLDDSIEISYRSVMGVDIPMVEIDDPLAGAQVYYGFANTNSILDEAYISFLKVKKMTAMLAEVENSIYRLAHAIVKTQRRANALENVVIPKYENITKFISDSLDEKDREEFARLKVIKAQKQKKEDQKKA